jgi:endonuclease/exonuclease/phosphatase family metal-dependent hydrolase
MMHDSGGPVSSLRWRRRSAGYIARGDFVIVPLSPDEIVKLISWNPSGRRDPEPQARALLDRSPDIVALQEITARSVTGWVKVFEVEGLHHVRSTVAVSAGRRRGPHAYGVRIASQYPVGDHVGVSFPVPLGGEGPLPPRRDAAGRAGRALRPCAARVEQRLGEGRGADRHTVLCGDFNTPKSELRPGEIITWAQHVDSSGRVRLQTAF